MKNRFDIFDSESENLMEVDCLKNMKIDLIKIPKKNSFNHEYAGHKLDKPRSFEYLILKKFEKYRKLQKKFLNYFNAKDFNSVILKFEELENNIFSLEKQIEKIKNEYQKKINTMNDQNESDQKKIVLLENTVQSLHYENDKAILIIESLRHENLQLNEMNIICSSFAKDKLKPSIQMHMQSNILTQINSKLQTQQQLNLQNQIELQQYNYNEFIKSLQNKINNITIQYQTLVKENKNMIKENQSLKIELQKLKKENIRIINKQNLIKVKIDNDKNDKKLLRKQIEDEISKLLTEKYQQKIEIMKLHVQTLEAKNKTLKESMKNYSTLKQIVKSLKRQNFNLEREIETLKIKNYQSPFKANDTYEKDSLQVKLKEKADVGIFTDDLKLENNDFEKSYNVEKERRKALANLLYRIVQMFDIKCDQLLDSCATILDSQNARIKNIQSVIECL